ncbi:MAG: protein kinase [Gemmataceae bacterium]|nr:protein kinase [Gemmataceae bacterium]
MPLLKRYDIRTSGDWSVWRAQDDVTRQYHLVKQVAEGSPYRAQLLRRLEHETAFLGQFTHAHLLRPVRIEPTEHRAIFEDVQCSLAQYVRGQGPLTPAQVGQVLLQASEALSALHARKKGHGCVNLHSLFVGPEGDVKFADFLGYEFDTSPQIPVPDPELVYQAPEVIDSGLGRIGPSADLYCLGYATLELLLGDRFEQLFDLPPGVNWLAWHADPRKQLVDWKASLGHVSAGLVDLIEGLIVKAPGERAYHTAAEFTAALKRSRLAQSLALPFYRHVEPASKPQPRYRPGPVKPRRPGGRGPYLTLTPLDSSLPTRSFSPGKAVLVGRADSCQLIPHGPGVSAKHALLNCHDDGIWRAYDLASTSGLFVNGVPRPRTRLRPGHVLGFGGVGYRVSLRTTSRRGVSKFQIRELLHEGANGRLFRADWVAHDGRAVALRFLPIAFENDEVEMRRFLRGIPAASTLRHPNLVRLYRAGVSRMGAERVWYLAMEYCPGRSLRDRMQTHEPLPVSDLVRLARDLASAITALGANGWVHRNINPSCVLLAEDGTAKLGDFGAYRPSVAETDRAVTVVAGPRGDLVYQAPECVAGEGEPTAAADVYSLGATLFEAATGQPSFDKRLSYPELCKAVCESPTPDPKALRPDLPTPMRDVIMTAMARLPMQRFATANALLDAVRSCEM